MLVIISDLHLTDGTSGEIISDSAFRLFKNRLSDMAYDASWRCDENNHEYYKPVEQIDILLLGDILDMIRSEKWNSALETIMPWTEERQDEFFANVEIIVTGILEFNASSFTILKGISEGDIVIPKEMRRANEDEKAIEKIKYKASNEKVAIKANIYYMIGNHDWFFYINDRSINNIRNSVIDKLGLSNEVDKPFPYAYNDSKVIQEIQQTHKVFAEHGDRFDKTNYQMPHRDASSVGDVVVIKLLNEIPKKIEECIRKSAKSAGSDEDVNLFIKQLREIDNLRPYSLAPAWISQVLKETKLDSEVVNQAINDSLELVLKEFRQNRIIAEDHWLGVKIRFAELVTDFFDIETLSNVIGTLGFSRDQFESYKQYAIDVSKDHNKEFFVMGHTHYAEVVPMNSYVDQYGMKRSKIYINTGTWRSVHFQGQADKDSFVSYKTMSIAGFFKPDERKGRAFEFWTGSLAL
jgi:UDP-2,3-diacylglucosamine pyrophosphatase LpxH